MSDEDTLRHILNRYLTDEYTEQILTEVRAAGLLAASVVASIDEPPYRYQDEPNRVLVSPAEPATQPAPQDTEFAVGERVFHRGDTTMLGTVVEGGGDREVKVQWDRMVYPKVHLKSIVGRVTDGKKDHRATPQPLAPPDCPCQDWCGLWQESTNGHHPSCDGHGNNLHAVVIWADGTGSATDGKEDHGG